MKPNRIAVRNVGQIREADIRFGDLTVLVGPQATGKSIFLQLLKLVIDAPTIHSELRRFNIDWGNDLRNFLDLYFGEGMAAIWSPNESALSVDGEERDLKEFIKSRRRQHAPEERLFFVPAQRVMSLRDGLTRTFTEYRSGDPFALRAFSERLHNLIQNEFAQKAELFPQSNRLGSAYRDQIGKHIFGGFGLQTDAEKFQRRIALKGPNSESPLPYLVWSAGQREFVPLLLGFYWLIPPSRVSRRDKLEWVVIEELEMGLHPDAISAVLALVLELLCRGYRVCLSTHSPHVLDVVWALRFLKHQDGGPRDVLKMLGLKSTAGTNKMAQEALKKDYRVQFFDRNGRVKDISSLDPAADDRAEADWGGLTGFSGRVGDIVAEVANRTAQGSR